MNCLVLGGGGFLGSHLCDSLVGAGHKVRIFEKKGSNRKNIEHLLDRVDLKEGDFSDLVSVQRALSDMEVVFHLIGTTIPQSSNDDPVYDLSSNLIPTLGMLEAAKKIGIKKVIFASSGGTVYGVPQVIPITEDHPTDPICSYGIQKLAVEKYIGLYYRLYGLGYTILRISNPYGRRQPLAARQGAISVFIAKAERGLPIEIWGDGTAIRDYIHVSDVIRALITVLDYSGEHRVFNIGSGIGHSLLDIISEIEKILDHPIEVKFMAARKVDVLANILAIARAENDLRWAPSVTFSEGISLMLRH